MAQTKLSKRNAANLALYRPVETLSPTEFEVVTLLAIDGARSCDMAVTMGIAEDTVKKHLWRAMNKVGCQNRTALALWYTRAYPTKLAQKEGYAQCWLYLAERMYTKLSISHNIIHLDEKEFVMKLTTDAGVVDDIVVPKGMVQ